MMKQAFYIAFATACYAGAGLAEPCVSSTFDVPLPNAMNVVTRHVDVPSPQFPGMWQEGTLEGYFYALYANGEGVLRPIGSAEDWELKITCDANGSDCLQTSTGEPPEETQRLAGILGSCMQGKSVEFSEAEAEAEAEAEVFSESEPACGIAAVKEGPEGIMLQRLLIEAGADPGPVDGLVGRGTRKALGQILGSSSRWLPIPEAIAALDRFLCE